MQLTVYLKNEKMPKKKLRFSTKLSLDARATKAINSHICSLIFKNHVYRHNLTVRELIQKIFMSL